MAEISEYAGSGIGLIDHTARPPLEESEALADAPPDRFLALLVGLFLGGLLGVFWRELFELAVRLIA